MSKFRVSLSVALIVALSSVLASQPSTAAAKPRTSWDVIQPLLNSGNLDDAKRAIIITLGPVLNGTEASTNLELAFQQANDIGCISTHLKAYLNSSAKIQKTTGSISILVAVSKRVPMGPYGRLIKGYLSVAGASMNSVKKISNWSQARTTADTISLCMSS
jgi:hypothetical protein